MEGSGWDASQKEASSIYVYFFAQLQVCTRLWRRQHLLYSTYPLCLARFANNNVPDAEKEQIYANLVSVPDCCLDEGCSLRLRSLETLKRDLPSIVDSLSIQKPLNAEIEDNFARHQSAAVTSRGCLVSTSPIVSSLSSKLKACFKWLLIQRVQTIGYLCRPLYTF